MYKLFSFLILFPLFSPAQNVLTQSHIQISGGTSFNGTGDISGFAFNTEYGQYFKKKYSWYAGIGGTIHDKEEPIFYTNQSGNLVDASVRATIAGFQLTGLFAYNFIKEEEHNLLLGIGPLLRYQSTSYWDALSIYPPAGTGLPFPVVTFDNRTPQRTFAIGVTGRIGYHFTINKKISLGILGSLQFDSNGDVIRNALLSLGRRF